LQRSLALVFALVGTALLTSIAYFTSARQPWLVLLCVALSLGFIGFGFVLKARMSRRNNSKPKD